MNFEKILEDYNRIAIIGTYKNAGKTVALNEFINVAAEKSIRLGLTSIGRDGERKDVVTATEKPPIYAPEGTIVATAETCLSKFTAPFEILDVTPFQTAIGRVVICSLKEPGYIEIAGPDSNSEIIKVSKAMKSFGAQKVFIDGALSRKTQASPAVADGVVLATGAVLSRSIDVVVDKTKHSAKLLMLPKVDVSVIDTCKEAVDTGYICFLTDKGELVKTSYKTALSIGDKLLGDIKDNYSYVVVPGTLMTSFIKSFHTLLRYKNIKIVVRDGTKIFCEPMDYKIFEKLGGIIEVIDTINLLAVTINPYSPEGYYFEPGFFLTAMTESLSPLDVFDCMLGGA